MWQSPYGLGYNVRAQVNPYLSWARMTDCGDIPVTPLNNAVALAQMSEAFLELGQRPPPAQSLSSSNPYRQKPKLLALGGDHSIALPALRALHKIYEQPITVVHFDAHLDTYNLTEFVGVLAPGASPQDLFSHGSMFWIAAEEGILDTTACIHGGLRTRLFGTDTKDLLSDSSQGWDRIFTDDIDDIGMQGVITRILDRVGTERPVYLSVDIDVIDPGLAPGTGSPEAGGWTTREFLRILRGLEPLNLVGADVVEVNPSFDDRGEATAVAAAHIGYEILTNMVKRGA